MIRTGLLLLCFYSGVILAVEVSGLAQVKAIDAGAQTSWQQQRTGILRDDQDGIHLQQALLKIEQNLLPGWDMQAAINLHEDGAQHLGLTLNWQYRLTSSWKLGLEHHYNTNRATNRKTLSQSTRVDQQHSLTVLEFRWK